MTTMKLTLPPKPSVPPAVRPVVRPVVRLELPGKPPLHVMRARHFIARARVENHILVYCDKLGSTPPSYRTIMVEKRNRYMQKARAALAQGKENA